MYLYYSKYFFNNVFSIIFFKCILYSITFTEYIQYIITFRNLFSI